MTRLLLTILIILATICSCENNDSYYFNGEIINVGEFASEKHLKGTEVFLDGAYEGKMMVHDSIMLFLSLNPADYWMHTYNIKTGNPLAQFCHKGEGPDDFMLCVGFEQFVEEDGDLKLWVNDFIKSSRLVNITKSISTGRTVCDSIIPMKWIERHRFPPVGMFFLDNGDFMSKPQCELLFLNEGYVPRNYYKCHESLDNETDRYIHYKCPIEGENVEDFYMMYYASCDRIKPDLEKIAMSMQMIPQINIWDLKTNTLKGYRQKGGASFTDLEKSPDKYRYYYMKMCVSDKFILAPYVDKPMGKGLPETSCIHVFNWDGAPLYKLHLTENIYGIALDDKNGILYAYDLNDHIYSYDVSFLK